MALVKRTARGATPARVSPEAVRAQALQQLADLDESRRRWAARQLVRFPDTASLLCARLRLESSAAVREAILTSLMQLNSAEAVRGLLPLLNDDDASVRNAVVEALREMPQPVAPFIARLLADASADVRLFALELFQVRHHPHASEMLLELIAREPQVNVLAAAVDRLGELGSADVVPALLALSARFPEEPYLQFATIAALERIDARRCRR